MPESIFEISSHFRGVCGKTARVLGERISSEKVSSRGEEESEGGFKRYHVNYEDRHLVPDTAALVCDKITTVSVVLVHLDFYISFS